MNITFCFLVSYNPFFTNVKMSMVNHCNFSRRDAPITLLFKSFARRRNRVTHVTHASTLSLSGSSSVWEIIFQKGKNQCFSFRSSFQNSLNSSIQSPQSFYSPVSSTTLTTLAVSVPEVNISTALLSCFASFEDSPEVAEKGQAMKGDDCMRVVYL